MSKIDEKILEQIEEDRERTKDLYTKVTNEVVQASDYAVLGDVIVKVSDLLTKQTNQLIEMYKIQEKGKEKKPEGLGFSLEEAAEIEDKIESMGKLSVK